MIAYKDASKEIKKEISDYIDDLIESKDFDYCSGETISALIRDVFDVYKSPKSISEYAKRVHNVFVSRAIGKKEYSKAETDEVETFPTTRRCKNKLCINRFVPVNANNFYCSNECHGSDLQWTSEEILQEEGSLLPEATHLEMAKRAFEQKNQLIRKVTHLTSLRDFFRFEIKDLHDSDPSLRFPIVYSPPLTKQPTKERELTVVCSDWQIGKMENGIGVKVMEEERIPRLIEATRAITKQYVDASLTINKIRLVLLGDMLEGCWIYPSQNVTGLDRTANSHRITKQIPLTARLISSFVMDIASYVPEVIVESVPGNHGRPNGRNDFADPEDNFDTMISYWAQDKCANQPNITWNIHEEWWGSFNTLGHDVVMFHGDQWRGPVQDLQKLLPQWIMSNVFKCSPKIALTGHRHDFSSFRVNGLTVVQNGTIDGGSNWYLRLYGKASPPTQTILITSEKRGLEAIYPVYF